MAGPENKPARQPAGRRRRRPARWLVRLVLLCGVILLVVTCFVVAVNLVLRSDLPRQIVLQQVHLQTGLRVEAAQVQTTWAGRSQLRDLSLGSPLQPDALLTVDRIEVQHTPLLLLMLGRPVQVHHVHVDGAVIELRRDEQGTWNVQHVIDTVQYAAQGSDAAGGATGTLQLPQVRLTQSRVDAFDADGDLLLSRPVEAVVDAAAVGVYDLTVELEDLLTVQGRISPPQRMTHELQIRSPDLTPLAALIGPLAVQPDALPLSATWHGRMTGDRLEGELHLEHMQVMQFDAVGQIAVQLGPQGVLIHPHMLRVWDRQSPQLAGMLTSGWLRIDQQAVEAKTLRIDAADHTLELDANWLPQDQQGTFRLAYRGEVGDWLPGHEGQLVGSVHLPHIGQGRLQVNISSTGQAGGGDWHALGSVHLLGRSWQRLRGRVQFTDLSWRRDGQLVTMDGLTARLALRGPELMLDSLTLPQAERSMAEARYNLDTANWNLQASVTNWSAPLIDPTITVISLTGSGQAAKVNQLDARLQTANGLVTLNGSHDPARPQPLQATLVARWPTNRASHTVSRGALEGWTIEQAQTELAVAGRVWPRDLELAGRLELDGLAFNQRPIEDLRANWNGRLNAQQMAVTSKPTHWLGATWDLDVHHDMTTRMTRVTAGCLDLDLARLVELARIDEPLAGQAQVRLEANLPNLSEPPTLISGRWQVTQPQVGPIVGDAASGRINMRGRVLSFDQVALTRDDGRFEGQMRVELTEQPVARAVGELQQFSVDLPDHDIVLQLSGQADVTLQLTDHTASGQVNLQSAIHWQGLDVGQISLAAGLDGRVVVVEHLNGQTFGGQIDGHGRLDLNTPRLSRGEIRWHDIDAAALAAALKLPADEPIQGLLAGWFTAGPATVARPLEPLELRLHLEPGGVNWRGAALGQVSMTAYYGRQRLVIDHSDIRLLGGAVSIWSQITQRDNLPWLHLQVQVHDVDLAQLASVLGNDQLMGKVNSTAMIAGNPRNPRSQFGNITVNLTESDLIGFAPIGVLYSALNRPTGPSAEGYGLLHARLEAGRLNVPRIEYFNRGVEIIAEAQVEDLTLGLTSPVTGMGAGSLRPFRDIGLPGASTLDQFISLLQGSVAVVVVDGTAGDYNARVVPLPEVGAGLRRLLMMER